PRKRDRLDPPDAVDHRRVHGRAEHGDRGARVPALARGAAARAADHGDRRLVHPPERRPALEGPRAGLDPRRHPPAREDLHDRRRRLRLEPADHLRRHDPDAAAARLARAEDEAGEGDARGRAGQGRGGDDGDRRQPDDLVHVPDRRTPRGVRRRPLRALRHQRAVRHRIPARPLRLHRRRPRRHREPARRRPRRPLYRPDRAVQQRPRVAHARHRLDELADLRRPDPDPRVPARGPPRRANAGGRVRLSAGEVWQRRRDLGAVWWRGLGRLGLGRERFHSLRPWQQRLAKVALAGLIAFLLVLLVKILEHYFGVGRHSVLTFDASAYIAFLVVALLVVPEWTALPALPMRLVLPGAVAVAGLVGLIVGLATSNTRNGVISSLGTLIALVAPPWLASSGRRAVDTPILEK